MANINFSFGIQMDKSSVKQTQDEIKKIIQYFQREMAQSDLGASTLNEYKKHVKDLDVILKSLGNSYVNSLEKFNVSGFEEEVKSAGVNLAHVLDDLEAIGVKGSLSFDKFTSEVKNNRIELEKTDTLIDKTVTTLTKTYLWNMANRAVDVFNGKIQDSVKFIYDLDESLNNIQVVTGKSSDEMATFAKNANEAAQRLGQTTLAYTEGALLYLQQGKTMEEANYLTEATLVGASITGENSAEVAELLTASLNGYSLAAENAMEVTDKFAAVGAATGSSFYELATAFSKTASMASTVGVEFDQLTAQISTIATVTRETPETIGTSLKTIYARMSEISMGGSDGEYDFGAVKSQLEAVGISIVDSQNNLRDMGQVIEEIGEKWDTFGRNAQVAIANAMGGKLQANRLLALFNNWEMYQDALTVSMEATGAAEEQNAKRLESLSAKTNQLRAATEELYMTLLDSDGFKVMVEGATLLVQALTKIVDLLGGLVPILSIIGPAFLMAFGQKVVYDLSESIITLGESIKDLTLNGKNLSDIFKPFKESTDEAVEGVKAVQESIQELNAQSLAKMDEEQFKGFIKTSALSDEGKETLAKQRKEYSLLAQEIQKTEGALEGQIKAQEILKKENITATEAINEYSKALAKYYDEYTKAEETQKNNAKLLEELNKDREKNIEKIRDLESENEKLTRSFVRAKSAYEALDAENQELIRSTGELSEKLGELNKNINKTENNLDDQRKAQNSLGDSIEGYISRSEKAKNITGKLSKAMAWAGVAIEAVGAFKDIGNAMDELEGRGQKLSKAFGTLIGGGLGGILGSFLGPGTAAVGANIGSIIGKKVGDLSAQLFDIKTHAEAADKRLEEVNEELTKFNTNVSSGTGIEQRKAEMEAITDIVKKEQERIAIMNEVAEIYPELVKGYDFQGNAIVDLNQDFEEYAKKQKEAFVASSEFRQSLEDTLTLVKDGSMDFKEANKTLSEFVLGPILQASEGFNNLDTKLKNTVISLINFKEVFEAIKNGASFEDIQKMLSDQVASFEEGNLYGNLEKLQEATPYVQEMIEKVKEAYNLSGEDYTQFVDKIINKTDEAKDLTIADVMEIAESYKTAYEDNLTGLFDKLMKPGAKVDPTEFLDEFGLTIDQFLNMYETFLLKVKNKDKETVEETMSNLKDKGENAVKEIITTLRYSSTTDEQGTFFERLMGLTTAQLSDTELKAIEAKEKVMAEFKEGYKNPLSFATAGELDETIDAYQSLIEKNELLVELFNEGNDIEWREGHPFSQSFAEIIDGNVESAEELADKSNDLVLTLNEMFEDVAESGGSLTEFFDEDMANAIQTLVDNTELIDLPFAEWPDQMKDTLAEVYNHFADFETNAKSMYISLQATNEDFYQQLRKDNAETFAQWDKNFGLSGQSFKNMAEYQAAVDAWKYQQMSTMSDEHTNYIWQVALQRGLIEQNAAAGIVSVNDRKKYLLNNINKEELNDAIDAKIKELEARKKQCEKQLGLKEAEVNEELSVENDGYVKSSEQTNSFIDTLLNSFTFGLWTPIKSILQALGWIGGDIVEGGSTQVYDKAAKTVQAELDKINADIAALEGFKATIDAYEGYDPSGLDFDLPPYNPTGAPTTSPGGYKPSSSGSGSGGKGSGGKGSGGKGSGSSSKEETEKEVEDLEYKKDIYHDINIELQKTENLLTKLQEKEDDLYGQARINNMKEQVELIRRQKELTAQKLEIAKQERDELKKSLSNEGVQFDATGTITNYNDIIKAKTDWANSLSGEAKEAAKEYVEQLKDLMSSYEELHFTTIIDYESEIEEFREALQEKILEAVQYEYEINIEASVKFQEDADFLTDFLEGLESVDTLLQRKADVYLSQLDSLEAFEKRYNDILNNSDLDVEAKREAIEELKEDLKDALGDLKDFYTAISDYIVEVIENNTDAIDEQIDAFERINDELSDMIDMYDLLGKKDFDALNNMIGAQISSNEGQIDLLVKAREKAIDLRDSLEEGTEEWKAANEQVQQMDEDIRKLANDTVKLLQEKLQNTFDKTLDKVEKSLSNGLGFDTLEELISRSAKEQEKYYDAVEKSVWSARMLKQIQADINKQTDPRKQEMFQQFYESQVATLVEKDKLTAAEVERTEILYQLMLKQMALEEARSNKTIQRLVRDDQGNWVYQYMADLEAVASAQDNLTNSIDDLLAHDKQVYEDTQNEILERRKQFISDMKALQEAYLNGEIESEEEFKRLMSLLEEDFNADMLVLSEEYALAERNIAASTLLNIMDAYNITYGDLNNMTQEQKDFFSQMGIEIGDDWSSTLDNMTAANEDYTKEFLDSYLNPETGLVDSIKDAFEEMSQAADEYKDNVNQVLANTGMDFETMTGKVDDLKDSTDNLKETNKTLIEQMSKEYDAIKNILPQYEKIKNSYEEIRKSVQSYIDTLNKAIEKQKELANAPSPTSPGGSGGNGGSGSGGSSSGGSSGGNLGVGSNVRVKSGTRWYYDSNGKNPSGNAWTNRDLQITKIAKKGSHQYNVGTKQGEYLGWLKKTDFVGFKTGGYTGDWSKVEGMDADGGKMALLHQKEMVLNKEDTANLLKAVELVRDFSKNLIPNISAPQATNNNTNQNITIHADFSGVRNSSEIENAFNNLVNRAVQYSNQK